MKIYFVDAFTDQLFCGNPAAVCVVDQPLDESGMQKMAAEIGFSETAFIQPISEAHYSIRFFTTKQEIPLCGHATLAASKILFETGSYHQIWFSNINGIVLPVEKHGLKIRMQFPVYDTEPISVPDVMLDALGIQEIIASRYSPDNRMIMLEIADTNCLKNMNPDFVKLVNSYSGINGVLVTAKSEDDLYDFHYRYFWPWAGTGEDPVTGAVQTFLTKYWVDKLKKNKLSAFQSSVRTGIMQTELIDNHVYIYGEAVIVLEGMFTANL